MKQIYEGGGHVRCGPSSVLGIWEGEFGAAQRGRSTRVDFGEFRLGNLGASQQ